MELPDEKNVSNLTPSQQKAVEARGNALVMAGAGTGKTTTLVARCLDCLERDGATMEEILVVTFTEAAAAKLRKDLRAALENKLKEDPGDFRYAEQLALFDNAHIGTLHSFCLKLVREHFYELGLDPRLSVQDEGQARQLANETLDEQFAAHYAGSDDFSLAVQDLIQIHGGGRDEPIRQLVLQLHQHAQAQPDAAGWLARQREKFAAAEPLDWQQWLLRAIEDWRDEWLPFLESLANEKAAELAAILSRLGDALKKIRRDAGLDRRDACSNARQNAAKALAEIIAADGNWPSKRRTVLRTPIKDLFEEAEFLHSLAIVKDGADPLEEDWSWTRGPMATLLQLTEELGLKLAERKQTNGVLDFQDLEQFALELLWDFSTGRPTAVAANWRAKLKFIFVDEYQDINAAQDKIIQGLSRDGTSPPSDANRFLVGDVKQSIYRFRLADPKIFREYARDWHGAAGETIPLSENFRSAEGLLKLVNSVFRLIMRAEVGGVAYDADAELKFARRRMPAGGDAAVDDAAPRAELLLRFKHGRNGSSEDADGQLGGLDNAQSEARLVAARLQQLVAGQRGIFDDKQKIFRPVEWRDIAILLRSPRGRSEIFAKEFERAGIPLAVARQGFYQSAEILDLLSLLQLLDNPLQDVPCIAVLRSPLVGLSLDELAEIRLAAKGKHFWTALNRSVERGGQRAETAAKVKDFLERYSRWRRLAKLVSLSQCLEAVLAETLYADWLRGQLRGAQRAANVAGFLNLAQQFDQFQRQGLFRFLKFIEAQQAAEAEPEAPAAATENAVRLMSIHQGKGLEFPVVVLADLAKQFNEQDLRGEIIFDEAFGLCPKVKPPHTGRRYPSLPHWLAQRRQKRELRGEELRLLYVALTRARDYLILTGSIPEKSWDEKWNTPQAVTPRTIAAARCFADWLALWFANQAPDNQGQMEGALEDLHWQIVNDEATEEVGQPSTFNLQPSISKGRLAASGSEHPTSGGNRVTGDETLDKIGNRQSAIGNPSGASLEQLRSRLEWNYPFHAATLRKAKSSVTALRREAGELDEEAEQVFRERQAIQKLRAPPGAPRLSASEIGAAHHKFLQHMALDQTDALAAEAERLLRENHLSTDERAVLDLAALGVFWNSELGREIRAHADEARRELPFTARFSPPELAAITGLKAENGLDNEFVIVQGVADLAVLRPREIWLVDFKTDAVTPHELPEKTRIYSVQLRLYASALGKIFARRVTLRALHFLAAGRTVEV
jgi:ATP-dependent helicase/nuclease subunit A